MNNDVELLVGKTYMTRGDYVTMPQQVKVTQKAGNYNNFYGEIVDESYSFMAWDADGRSHQSAKYDIVRGSS